MIGLRELAIALGGIVSGGQVLAPGPGHSKGDRSLSVRLDASAPNDVRVYSFAEDDWRDCLDHVRARAGLTRETAPFRAHGGRWQARVREPGENNRDRAIGLWRRRKPIAGSIAESYLRVVRGYDGPIPVSVGFL